LRRGWCLGSDACRCRCHVPVSVLTIDTF
jgi:hypothetical protein